MQRAPRRRGVSRRNGPGCRRDRSDAEKARLVAETLAPDVCIADVARRHGLHPRQLCTWRRKAKRRELILPAEATPMFAEVLTVPEPGRTPEAETANGASTAEVAIELADLRLRIGPGVPPERVAALVSALRAST